MAHFPLEVSTKKPLDIDVPAFIEGSSKEEVLSAIKDFSQQESEDWFKLGMVLSYYRNNKPEEDWLHLVDYAEEHFQIKRRTTYYLVSIYDSLSVSGITFNQVKSIGWTKLKEVAHLLTADNVDYWVDVAATKTTKEIITLLKSSATTNTKVAQALDNHLESEPVVHKPEASPFVVEEYNPPTMPVEVDGKAEVIEVVYSQPAETDYEAQVVSKVVVPDVAMVEEQPSQPAVYAGATTTSDLASMASVLKNYDLDVVLTTVTEVFPHIQIIVKDLVGD